jgi:heme A synthase
MLRNHTVSRAWGLLPLAADDSDIMMLAVVLFILAILVISLFMAFPIHVALFFSGALLVGLALAIHETRRLADIENKPSAE